MVAQGVLPIQHKPETASSGTTGRAGLELYFELMEASGFCRAVRDYVQVCGQQGWLDLQMLLALISLNIAGGDCVDDIDRLEADGGVTAMLRKVERFVLPRRERKRMKARWRRGRRRTLPSPSAILDWLGRFHDPAEEAKREPGRAFVPAPTPGLQSLWRVNRTLLGFLQAHCPLTRATLDQDATLIESHKRQAYPCYKGFKAYQPLNCWLAEHGVVLHSEFRDGNVPAGSENLRFLRESLDHAAELGIEKVALRSDSAAYQQDLLLFCGEGRDERFGVIDFAISADVTQDFRQAVQQLPETAWQPLVRTFDDGTTVHTEQEWAEVCFVPAWVGHSTKRADYRFIAIREPLYQLPLGDADQLPFPTEEFSGRGAHKLFGLVTNLNDPGDRVIWWHRERCGKSEEAHAALKNDLAGGQMPSGLFGANAAWWAITALAHNLNAIMKQVVLGEGWVTRRMKKLRFAIINIPGRVVSHARHLVLRLSADGQTLDFFSGARRRLLGLADSPPG